MQATHALCLHLWCLTQATNCLVLASETRANSLLLARLPAESTKIRLVRGRPTQMVMAMPQNQAARGWSSSQPAGQPRKSSQPSSRHAAGSKQHGKVFGPVETGLREGVCRLREEERKRQSSKSRRERKLQCLQVRLCNVTIKTSCRLDWKWLHLGYCTVDMPFG